MHNNKKEQSTKKQIDLNLQKKKEGKNTSLNLRHFVGA